MTMPRARALLGVTALLAAAPHRAAGQSAVPADTAALRIARGRTLFQGKGLCFSCHGKEGEGLLAPSTRLTGRTLGHVKPTITDVAALIKAGVDSAHSSIGQPMPPRGGSRLTDAEVELVAWYVLELQKRPAPR